MESLSERKSRLGAAGIVGVYCLVTLSWIYLTDSLLPLLVQSQPMITRLSICKGSLSVVITAQLLYFLIARFLRQSLDADEKLRASEKRYRDIVENHTDYVDRYLPGGILTFVNGALARATGLAPAELLGRSFYPFLHAEDRERVIAAIEALSAENPVALVENRVRLDDGLHWMQWTHCALTDASGEIVEYQATGRDITAQKRTQDALRESEAHYRAMVMAFDGLMYICSSERRIEFLNEAMKSRIGRDATGEFCHQALHGFAEVCPAGCVLDRVLAGESIRWETRSAKDERWYEVSTTPVPKADGSVSMQAMIVDISERKRLHEELVRNQTDLKLANELLEQRVLERTAELEAAVQEQESFSYSVSHDLRAPLRHINSFSALLIEDHGEDLPAQAHDYLNRIRAASSSMGSLIDHLLDLSRITRTEITPCAVDLSGLADSTLGMLQETEPDRQVEADITPGITVQGDSYLLRQLLENLIGNAWKYTSKKPSARIEFGRTCISGQEAYFVKDNGAGFDMAYRKKLFKAFERLHGAEFEGIGIGLATAQRVVHRHGGSIWAEGVVDEGATFYFTLPVFFP